MIPDAEEAALWAASLAGDGRALTRLFALHRDRVFRYAARLVESDADADDVTAAAFFELWRRRQQVTAVEGSVLPWLLVTAGYIARNVRRGTRRWRSVIDRLDRVVEVHDPTEAVLDRIAVSRTETELGRALQRLRPIDLSLLGLTVFEGYSVAEAAVLLGLSPTAARTRLLRARNRVKADLRPATTAPSELLEREP